MIPRSRFSEFITGIAGNMLANFIGTILGLLLVTVGLTGTSKLDDIENWKALVVTTGLLLIASVSLNSFRHWMSKWKIRSLGLGSSSKRIGILLARLDGDEEAQTNQQNLRDSLRKLLGPDAAVIVTWPDSLRLADGNDENAQRAANNTARSWLRQTRCDVLISGRMRSLDSVSLQFTPRHQTSEYRAFYSNLLSTLHIDVTFDNDVAVAVSFCVLAQCSLAFERNEKAILKTISAIEEKLPSIVSRFSTQAPTLQFAYAEVCHGIAELQGSDAAFVKAQAAYGDAIKHLRPDMPIEVSVVLKCDFANLLAQWGKLLPTIYTVTSAIDIFDDLLQHCSAVKNPTLVATLQTNRGNALAELGAKVGNLAYLKRAVAAHREAIEVLGGADEALTATINLNLGVALKKVAEHTNSVTVYLDAISWLEQALRFRTQKKFPFDWARAQHNLGITLALLGGLTNESRLVARGVRALEKARNSRRREHAPRLWRITQEALATALGELGWQKRSRLLLKDSIALFDELLDSIGRKDSRWAHITTNKSRSVRMLGELTEDVNLVRRSGEIALSGFLALSDANDPAADIAKEQLDLSVQLLRRLSWPPNQDR